MPVHLSHPGLQLPVMKTASPVELETHFVVGLVQLKPGPPLIQLLQHWPLFFRESFFFFLTFCHLTNFWKPLRCCASATDGNVFLTKSCFTRAGRRERPQHGDRPRAPFQRYINRKCVETHGVTILAYKESAQVHRCQHHWLQVKVFAIFQDKNDEKCKGENEGQDRKYQSDRF